MAEALFLPRDQFLTLGRERPEILLRMLATLSERLASLSLAHGAVEQEADDSPDENDLQLHMVAVAGDGSAASNPVVLSGDAHMLGNGSIAGSNDTFLAAFNAVEDTGCTDPCKRDIFTRAFSYVPEESP